MLIFILDQPETLHFAPYSMSEMVEILSDRVKLLPSNVTIHPAALELCARKVAGMGDFRKALDILSQVATLYYVEFCI